MFFYIFIIDIMTELTTDTIKNTNAKLFIKGILDYPENDTSTTLHQLLYNEIYEYFIMNNNKPTKIDLEMIEYLSPKKVLNNNSIRDVIKYLLLFTYKANANEIKNHKKINDSLEKIQEQLTTLLKLHEKPEPSTVS